jgi:formylglycine-generating enzyme required for sulfatase activity
MEWMFAARSANQSQNYIYSGSNQVGEVAWYVGNAQNPMNVGLKLPNELGLYDMSGNVWEFCWDIYNASYPANDITDPTGALTGTHRVLRGGSWTNDATNCTIARRFYSFPDNKKDYIGFRVVRNAR